MSILINKSTNFMIQGITGKQGTRACLEMLSCGSKVVCGVTPGKGGQTVENVPVYNSIKEAQEHHQIDASVLYIPPKFAKAAILEALEAGIPLLNIITENIPMHDMAYCLSVAEEKGIRIIGATSAGIYSVGKAKCGSIACGKSKIAFTPGPIGVISRSGGMSCETSLVLTQAGLGQSTVVSIGSDVLMGSSYVDLISDYERDQETRGLVLFGEIGGTSEEDLATYLLERKLKNNPYPKPIVAFISGIFAKDIQNVSLGHAGAIIEGNRGTREQKVEALKEAGVIIANVHHQVGDLMKKALMSPKLII
jgi:succinyl-CoA synthetase alpha subunit